MASSKKEPLDLSARDFMLVKQALRSYVAPPTLQDELVSLYERIEKYLKR